MITAPLGPELGKNVSAKRELSGGTQGRAAPAGSPTPGVANCMWYYIGICLLSCWKEPESEIKPCFFLEWVGRRAEWLGAGGEVPG